MKAFGRVQARDRCRSRLAFTLVELLVVVAVIGILAALLLPVLTQAKSNAKNISCLNNLKQLTISWHLYVTDNADYVPPNNFVYNIFNDQAIVAGSSWCMNVALRDLDPSGITQGLLFPYNDSISVYHCPADTSTVVTADGVDTGVLRLRLATT